jgi:S1-C subfamily serine protease
MGKNSGRGRQNRPPPAVREGRLIKAIELARPSVCQIVLHKMFDPDGGGVHIIGTGFAVAPGVVATARHVLTKAQEVIDADPGFSFNVGYPSPHVEEGILTVWGGAMYVGAELIAEDAATDIALLRTPDSGEFELVIGDDHSQTPRPARLAEERPTEGEWVACSGYPLAESSMVTTSGYIASSYTVARQTVVGRCTE